MNLQAGVDSGSLGLAPEERTAGRRVAAGQRHELILAEEIHPIGETPLQTRSDTEALTGILARFAQRRRQTLRLGDGLDRAGAQRGIRLHVLEEAPVARRKRQPDRTLTGVRHQGKIEILREAVEEVAV